MLVRAKMPRLFIQYIIYTESTCSDKLLTSLTMESISLLLSRPRVKGTMQKLHILSHPLIIELRVGMRSVVGGVSGCGHSHKG